MLDSDWSTARGMPGAGQRDNSIPRFYMEAEFDDFASKKTGKAVYRDVEKVEIIIPGDNKTVMVRKVLDRDRARWPEHYKRFKAGLDQSEVGTPLHHLPYSPAQIAELKAFKINSIEQLASVTDQGLGRMGPGAREMRDRAAAYLDAMAGQAPVAKLQTEVEQMRGMMEEKDRQIQELSELLKEAAEQAKRRGRAA